MTQPTFVPVADSGAVRRCAPTATAEIGRPKKPGLLGAPHSVSGSGHGTPGPDAGYALTLAHSIVHDLTLAPNESAHDVEVAMALLASKRAGLVGRGPTKTDVEVALDLFRFRGRADATEAADRLRRIKGIAHSYVAQRSFVDGVPEGALRQRPGMVTPLVHWAVPRTPR